ncbi:hypothetical protein GPUN_1078 [Glaciecola punicea ACAM 611]|uniref:Uncharacterized protein n=1 Tax=Glaciecola punicea ACAM 611 TaxID=1121923 RepID=H5TA82_9ALTE|nr:hypothetical protein GPUN_1078 [Glaciecola punicea ACAM 611]
MFTHRLHIVYTHGENLMCIKIIIQHNGLDYFTFKEFGQ